MVLFASVVIGQGIAFFFLRHSIENRQSLLLMSPVLWSSVHIRLWCNLVPRVSPPGSEVGLGGVHGEGCRRDIPPRIETGDRKASTY